MPEWVAPVAEYSLEGLRTTVLLSLASVAASCVLGVIIGSVATLPIRSVNAIVRLYVELWRGLPEVVTLFLVFFALPVLGFDVSVFSAAFFALTLWGSANVAEVVRGAVSSIPREQHESADALGFPWARKTAHILLPQAARRSLPPTVGICTNLIQSSTLATLIGLVDLLGASRRSIERLTISTGTTHAELILGSVLVVFFLICFPLTRLARRLERRLDLSQ